MAFPSVTIHSSSTIIPSHPTPHRTLALSESDQAMLDGYSFTIYVYKKAFDHLDASSLAMDSMRNSLSKILVPYYPLAGRLRWIDGGRLELDCCGAGVRFIEAEAFADAKLDDYGDFAPSDATRQLVPKPDHRAPIEDQPLVLVQVTRFSCGGIVIGTAISHFVVDGISAIMFVNLWASITQGEKTIESIIPKWPNHERDFLQPVLDPPRFHHREYESPPLLIGRSDVKEERSKETTVALLKLAKHQHEKLKKMANEGSATPQRPYTRFEAVGGHIWACVCKARSNTTRCESDQPTVALITASIRQRIRPPPPERFCGNAILLTVTPICKFGDLIKNPLSYAAGNIREGTWKLTDEYIKSAISFLASKENELVKECYQTEVTPFWGNPNLDLGCWTSMPIYDADFGWGRPSYVGPTPLVVEDGLSIIMPGPDDGSLILIICLQTKCMNEFKKLFYQHL
ncbi:spermidine hydroxycinnamoyl transferase-like [Momordica charantia]|uniref:Spermidine hydroxycinnamoyl transferase-like n=1 Tax=Momordica charantia TaxID=3673 RepID=A0A6J1DU82_MOMCH|nr:spermidine hydroxycinnamoyl transferase-like [Momordica charantia]